MVPLMEQELCIRVRVEHVKQNHWKFRRKNEKYFLLHCQHTIDVVCVTYHNDRIPEYSKRTLKEKNINYLPINYRKRSSVIFSVSMTIVSGRPVRILYSIKGFKEVSARP